MVNELSIVPAVPAQPVLRETSPPVTARPSAPKASTAVRNPLRGQGQGLIPVTQTLRRPQQKEGLAKRLETAIVGPPEPKPAARAERVPSSYRTLPAERTSAKEEMPQPMMPQQHARPVATNYTAMQACPRGARASNGPPLPMYTAAAGGGGVAPARYDQPCLPNYAWPSYAAYPNYAAVTYPKQYSPTAWPYIGPFYPYPQVPLGWRKVTLEWDDGWWFLDFKDQPASCWHR